MNWASECIVVIPCLNESAGIRALVGAVRAFLPRVLVVDDGSSDATAAEAAAGGAEVIRQVENQGKGAALALGWERALAVGATWALMMDGDGQHAPSDIPRLLARAEATGASLVIGNRMEAPGAMPWVRRQANRWMSQRLSRLTGRELPDSQCGFRLMRLDAWRRAGTTARCFEIESDVLHRFAAAGERIEFVPVQAIYGGGRSRIRPVRDTVRWFLWWRLARRRRGAESSAEPNVEVAKDSPCRAA